MKLVASYANVTLESSITKEIYKKAKTHCPDAFILKDENKVPYFALEAANGGVITNGGVRFDNMTGNGNLFVTIIDKDMPTETDKRRQYLNDNYGRIAYLTKKVEDQVTAALAALESEIQTIADAIVIE